MNGSQTYTDQGTAKRVMPARKFDAIKRRHDFLLGLSRAERNSYDAAELSALEWVLFHHERSGPTPPPTEAPQ